ncbi:MAG: sigma-70 family RNA polymerase sigma factor [Acidobacteriota bacterium]
MALRSTEQITDLLIAWGEGDQGALDRLTPIIYDELKRLARRYMRREPRGHTLQPTALVHEAYLRLIDWKTPGWHNRAQFFAIAARVMRHVLVDSARSAACAKRGGAAIHVSLDDAMEIAAEPGSNVVAIDEALIALAALDPRQSKVVELRFFGGLTWEEVADVLEVSVGTVRRDWSLAKVWIYRQLTSTRQHDA